MSFRSTGAGGGGRGGGVGHAVGVDPEALLAAAGAAGDAAATLDGFADLAALDGADDAGTDGVALAYGDVADGGPAAGAAWPTTSAR